MENKGLSTKILAIGGTVLVWFPVLAPILLAAVDSPEWGCFATLIISCQPSFFPWLCWVV